MIYIFDDRAQRRDENEARLRKFSDIVSFETVSIMPNKTLEENFIEALDNPVCVIFHKSYVFDDNTTTFEDIRSLFTSRQIPFVIFSGGTDGVSKGTQEININADLMYENLPYFIENFKAEKTINIDTLLWGKRYELNGALQLQNLIAEKYFINNNLNDLIDDVDDVKWDILQSSHNLSDDFGSEILSALDHCDSPTWQELADIMDRTIQKFK